jgi:hypothetical protein
LLAHGRWFSPGTPASSTIKTDRHDIAEILLKVALKHQKSNHSEERNFRVHTISFNIISSLYEVLFHLLNVLMGRRSDTNLKIPNE